MQRGTTVSTSNGREHYSDSSGISLECSVDHAVRIIQPPSLSKQSLLIRSMGGLVCTLELV